MLKPKQVNISTLKARLTSFLRLVKKGEEVIILDRNQVIGKIVPWTESKSEEIVVHSASEQLKNFDPKMFSPVTAAIDATALLAEDRDDRLP